MKARFASTISTLNAYRVRSEAGNPPPGYRGVPSRRSGSALRQAEFLMIETDSADERPSPLSDTEKEAVASK